MGHLEGQGIPSGLRANIDRPFPARMTVLANRKKATGEILGEDDVCGGFFVCVVRLVLNVARAEPFDDGGILVREELARLRVERG